MSESETIRNAKKRLHTMKWNKVITSLIFIILGVVLLIWPNTALDVVCRIVGAGLLVGGVVTLWSCSLSAGTGILFRSRR